MNLNLLNTFQALAETLSFTETARRLNTVQPAVSRQIRGLEEALGYTLFDRSRKKVSLTPKGAELLHKIAKPLEELDVAIHPRPLSSDPSGDLFVGSTPEAGTVFLWPRLMQLQKRFPNLKVNLQLASSAEVQEAVRNGRVHLGLVMTPPKSKSYEVSPQLADPSVLVQATRTKHKQWMKREKLEFVTYRPQDPFTAQFLRKHLPKRLRKIVQECASVNSHIAMIQAVTERDWLAIMPRSSAERFARDGEIEIVLEERKLFGLYLFCLDRFLVEPANALVWQELLKRLSPE